MASDTNIQRVNDDDRLGTALASEQIRGQILGGLAPWMDEKQFTAAALTALSDGAYAKFSTGEKMKAILQFALLGLYPGPRNHAYIIPRGPQLTVMPGFRGYVYLARQLPGVHDVTAHLVHESDDFEVVSDGAGTFTVLRHEFDPLPPKGGRVFTPKAGLRGAYVKMEMKDGTTRYHFVTSDKIEQARGCAQTQNIWTRFFAEMAIKTAVRDAYARGFMHGDDVVEQRIARMVERDDDALGNDPARVQEPAKLDAPRNAVTRVMDFLHQEPEPKPEPKPRKTRAEPRMAYDGDNPPRTRVEPREEPEATRTAPEAETPVHAQPGADGAEDRPFTADDLNMDFDLEPSRAGRER